MSLKESAKRPPGYFVLLVLALLFSLAVIANSISSFVASFAPDIAISLNPLNSKARIEHLSRTLATDVDAEKLTKLEHMAVDGIVFEPTDARYYSLLGIIRENQNETAKAQALYVQALTLLPTEIQALTRRIEFDFHNGDYAKIVPALDLIARRWPEYFSFVTPYLSTVLNDPEAYAAALNLFVTNKNENINLKTRLLEGLLEDDLGLKIASDLVLDWSKNGERGLRAMVNAITAKYYTAKQYRQAYLLFWKSLSDDERKELGYIFNGNFNIFEPLNNAFSWKFHDQAGVVFKIEAVRTTSTEGVATTENALEIRFLDTPVKLSSNVQNLLLPPANFELSMDYFNRDLRAPKPIKLAIFCRGGGSIAVMELAPMDETAAHLSQRISVPAAQCESQYIKIYNESQVESWNERYSGSIFIQNISINLLGN